MGVEDVIKRHASAKIIGKPGYPLPAGRYTEFRPSAAEDLDTLRTFGLHVVNAGTDNTVWVEDGFRAGRFDINFSDRSGNCVVVGAGFTLGGRIDFMRDRSTAFIGGGNVQVLTILCDSDDAVFYCGPNCYIGDATCWVQGHGRMLAIGEDCMFGWKIAIRTGDFHGMFDLATKAILNPPEDTIIGPHVWLTNTVQIMKGLTIGAGSVVGASSVVTKSLPGSALTAGSPAKVIRRGVGWSREAVPPAEYMEELASRAYIDATVPAVARPRSPLHRLLGVLGRGTDTGRQSS